MTGSASRSPSIQDGARQACGQVDRDIIVYDVDHRYCSTDMGGEDGALNVVDGVGEML